MHHTLFLLYVHFINISKINKDSIRYIMKWSKSQVEDIQIGFRNMFLYRQHFTNNIKRMNNSPDYASSSFTCVGSMPAFNKPTALLSCSR